MTRRTLFSFLLLATFLQAGAYGLTFLLPRLFAGFGADEKTVGAMLLIATLATLIAVYLSGHLSDRLGRVQTLSGACLSIAAALALFAMADGVGVALVAASLCLGAGWGLTYALIPVVVTTIVEPEDRVRFFALHSVVVMAGFGLSPVMASVMEDAGYQIRDAFLLTAGLCIIAALIFLALIPRLSSFGAGSSTKSQLSLQAIGQILRSPARLPVVMVCIGASVFAGMSNFQTVMADERGLDYAGYFLTYTLTVVLFRLVLARFKGGRVPYLTIAALQYVMCGSLLLFLVSGDSPALYLLVAVLFGIGYGVSYPILAAMGANDAAPELLPQTLQFFALTYFIGIFGFPLIAGWVIVELGSSALLTLCAILAGVEATLALKRGMMQRSNAEAARA
ncbi:MAG: MFS transporter [Rhodobacteraceae bacterium]|nr:MFS transporter [Paracoccaceae bacterium]